MQRGDERCDVPVSLRTEPSSEPRARRTRRQAAPDIYFCGRKQAGIGGREQRMAAERFCESATHSSVRGKIKENRTPAGARARIRRKRRTAGFKGKR